MVKRSKCYSAGQGAPVGRETPRVDLGARSTRAADVIILENVEAYTVAHENIKLQTPRLENTRQSTGSGDVEERTSFETPRDRTEENFELRRVTKKNVEVEREFKYLRAKELVSIRRRHDAQAALLIYNFLCD